RVSCIRPRLPCVTGAVRPCSIIAPAPWENTFARAVAPLGPPRRTAQDASWDSLPQVSRPHGRCPNPHVSEVALLHLVGISYSVGEIRARLVKRKEAPMSNPMLAKVGVFSLILVNLGAYYVLWPGTSAHGPGERGDVPSKTP